MKYNYLNYVLELQRVNCVGYKLCKLILKENVGLDLLVVYPIFISTADDTSVFASKGTVDDGEGKLVISKHKDIDTRLAYTQKTSSTDSLYDICIRTSLRDAKDYCEENN